MHYQDEESLKVLISPYQQRIFALVLCLTGENRDKAYDIAVSSFVEAIRTTPLLEKDSFLARIAGIAIKKSRDIKIMPSYNESDFMNIPPEQRESLRIVKIALHSLPFDLKILLLLRDQLHLAYKYIAGILRISERNTKIRTTQARIQLRKKIEEVLRRGG